MDAVEFQAEIKNGNIEVPGEYRERLTKRVRVILLPESESTSSENFVDMLLANPLRMKDFRPLTREEAHAR